MSRGVGEEVIGRLGFEAYYAGKQERDDNPFRFESKPYVEMGLMGELDFGSFSVFANAENILDVRQTKHDSLIRPIRAPGGTGQSTPGRRLIASC